MLDFRIETFLCVCKNMNYTKAAEELNLTQPAVSQHIKYLEEYFEAKLFSYNKKKLSLTSAGIYLKKATESVYNDSRRIKEHLKNYTETPLLNIGATLSIGGFFLPKRLGEFIKSNRKYRISLTVGDTECLLKKLENGEIDIAFVEGYFHKNDYTYSLIKQERIIAAASPAFEIGKIKKLSDIFTCPLLLREKGSGTREILERGLRENGYDINDFSAYTEINSPHVIRDLLLCGTGISFLYESVVSDCLQTGTLKEIPIPDFSLCHEFNAIRAKNSIFAESLEEVTDTLLGGI